MSIETGVLIGVDLETIFWHTPDGRNSSYLPDSPDLWDVMWENRHSLLGFAHSHPGAGVPGPSYTDITTFTAIEKALGRQLVWWICSSTDIVVCRQFGKSDDWVATPFDGSNLRWLPKLRQFSYWAGPDFLGWEETSLGPNYISLKKRDFSMHISRWAGGAKLYHNADRIAKVGNLDFSNERKLILEAISVLDPMLF